MFGRVITAVTLTVVLTHCSAVGQQSETLSELIRVGKDNVILRADSNADREQELFAQTFAAWPNLDTSLWKVVFDGEEIAGQVLNFFDEDENRTLGKRRGWTEDISVQRKWRNQGVAKAAIAESMRMFKEMGMTEVALEVHTTNPTGAYQLYEGLGYEVIETGHEFRKRLQVG